MNIQDFMLVGFNIMWVSLIAMGIYMFFFYEPGSKGLNYDGED